MLSYLHIKGYVSPILACKEPSNDYMTYKNTIRTFPSSFPYLVPRLPRLVSWVRKTTESHGTTVYIDNSPQQLAKLRKRLLFAQFNDSKKTQHIYAVPFFQLDLNDIDQV